LLYNYRTPLNAVRSSDANIFSLCRAFTNVLPRRTRLHVTALLVATVRTRSTLPDHVVATTTHSCARPAVTPARPAHSHAHKRSPCLLSMTYLQPDVYGRVPRCSGLLLDVRALWRGCLVFRLTLLSSPHLPPHPAAFYHSPYPTIFFHTISCLCRSPPSPVAG